MKSFARGLSSDYEAVEAGITSPWSNGPVEGQINRLKLVKRSMYGRAKFDLLTARVLPMATAA
jgi:transposase